MECSQDRFLDGRIVAHQPLNGFRAGIDAVMLAAAVPACGHDELLELGSGTGIASLCLAARVPECVTLGVEIAPELVKLARTNARANGLESRLSFECADALDLAQHVRRSFDHVFCNPPFHQANGNVSPSRERARARQDAGRLAEWLAAGLRRVRAGGTFSTVVRADRLGEALQALPQRGAVIFPLWPREGAPAKRAIVQVRKNSRSPLVLLAGLILHEKDGSYTQNAELVLRQAGSLALASPRL
ncbi:MAG TPA: methyltransferase domain-containing protein [Rhizomicrobium sp.]|jgi:tRNA1(Val) A37 N6-methylase TrmN6|nr:methyltransferase domain-containing protein [Rhizomicrobium sp.]